MRTSLSKAISANIKLCCACFGLAVEHSPATGLWRFQYYAVCQNKSCLCSAQNTYFPVQATAAVERGRALRSALAQRELLYTTKERSDVSICYLMADFGACCSAQDTYIPARGKAVVKTGLSIAIPAETYARVAPRSGLAVKHFIDTGAGVVDEDYRGEVGVVLFNHSNVDFQGDSPVTTLI